MNVPWLKVSPSLNKGVGIINGLEGAKFEQFLQRIVAKLKLQDTEIFTEDEEQKLGKIFKVNEENLLLAIKTILYLYKRMLKYIFMPSDLKDELVKLGLNSEKADYIVKVWSNETGMSLNQIGSIAMDEQLEDLNFSWKLNAELSSSYQKKCKIPKVYVTLSGRKKEIELEMTHPELYSVFLQFESIQNDLDNLF